MCHRMNPLTMNEVRRISEELREGGRASAPRQPARTPDAFPGTQLPLLVPGEGGELEPALLTWGFSLPGREGLVFNTRLETALEQARTGRGMWAGPMAEGRCLVPVHGFYESWTQPNAPAREGDAPGGRGHTRTRASTSTPPGDAPGGRGRKGRRQVLFRLDGHPVFLLACVRAEDRFSVVTTVPNSTVFPVHDRMPLVLGRGESQRWLDGNFAGLANRGSIKLTSELES